MGNNSSVPNPPVSTIGDNSAQNNINETIPQNEDVFDKIKNISNDIFSEYNDSFLNQKFCDEIAFVFQKKLKELDISVLKNIHNQMNQKDNEIDLVLQYLPKQNETFISDFFQDKLNEYFWDKGVSFEASTFEKNGVQIRKNSAQSHLETYYINPTHVRTILDSFQKQSGGQPNNNFRKNLEKQLRNLENSPSSNINRQNLDESVNNMIESNNNNSQYEVYPTLNQNQSNSNYLKLSNMNNQENNKQNSGNNKENTANNKNTPNSMNQKNNKSKELNNIINNQKKKNNKNINESIKKNINKNINKNIDKNIQNRKKQSYYVPHGYKEPRSYCKESNGKCILTKRELCLSITQNLIVRNNIIAAILTTIPEKTIDSNGSVLYSGGICFQKFLNLERGYVCLPLNYKELAKRPIHEVIPELLKTSSFMDQKSCYDNNGYYLKLTNDEKDVLKKRAVSSEEELTMKPQYRANKAYIDFIVKLKNKYFESLNALILILEKIKEKPFISNDNLNSLALESKNIIDNMYNYVNKYYLYAIFSLIQSDYSTKADIKEKQVNQIVSLSKL